MAKDKYHHENLRAELLAAAREAVERQGHETLSVRALAQLTNVSPGAPYHHFPDRRSLLLAVAMEGFDLLFSTSAAIGVGVGNERLAAMIAGFLDFQREHPRLFELMYESELTRPSIEPAIAERLHQGFEILTAAMALAVPLAPTATQRAQALAFWSAMYGLAKLQNRGLVQSFMTRGVGVEEVRAAIMGLASS